jgi:hypothetical protein
VRSANDGRLAAWNGGALPGREKGDDMARVECAFYPLTDYRKADEPTYQAAFERFRQLGRSGDIRDPCRVQIGERQGCADVFATIWRPTPMEVGSGWKASIDAGEPELRYRYDRHFNPGEMTARDVIDFVSQALTSGAAPTHRAD